MIYYYIGIEDRVNIWGLIKNRIWDIKENLGV